ncbi:MAG TPA: hypothetical protein VFI52_04110 [Gemmatimonadaceae bacterium]|nr:hypothetical protein [Gemmatimonadaceae bacterium]
MRTVLTRGRPMGAEWLRLDADTDRRVEGGAPLATSRAPYVAPALQLLGEWRALTLQQSVCTGSGCAMITPLKSRSYG